LLEAHEHGNEVLKARLAELVMDGLPMEIRGLAWKTFLDLSVRRQRGYYTELTQRALKDLANKQHLVSRTCGIESHGNGNANVGLPA
jgi:hypothetical protein